MATRRNTRAKEAQLGFEALAIEGSLLSPEWLSKIAQLAADSQSESDYRIPKGLNLRDEIGRYWRISQAHWKEYASGLTSSVDRAALAERFVTSLLRESFGFASLARVVAPVLSERSYPIGYAALGLRVPVVIAPSASGIDTLSPEFGDEGRRRSAFGLAQEYLNAAEGAVWGIATDGSTLRILRDNASLTRPAWIEADLARIFTEERYADFAALWLLLHETRFGREGQPANECALEAWREAGRKEGTRAREHLRKGVEEALTALGQGFLSHPDNQALRSALQDGSLSSRDYFSQLLRLVYRLIFLLTVEERNLLHPEGTSDAAKALYAGGYALRRLCDRSVKRSAHDRFSDLWDSAKVVLRGLASGEPRLGLPALAGIFARNQCPALDAARLENRALLLALFKLAWLREDGALARVNWRDMGPEELGSVYESLLELVPQANVERRQFGFATGDETKGNARKTTGSYYTPDSLVQVLLDSALEPVIADTIAKNPGKSVEALLGLSIVDPACGSGHFLLAAARRLAAHVARLQSNGTPSGAEYRHALRQVVGKCIYGVDLNPMAVELCKVSLWMEAVEPGLPLTFLNSHIQHGNALLGTTPELMAKGIPDAAWDPIEGDDRKVASALKKRNKQEASGQRGFDTLWSSPAETGTQAVTKAVNELEAASDADAVELARKEAKWEGILTSQEYRQQKFVADAWCAAFVWPKQLGPLAEVAPTNELWRQLRDGQGRPPELTQKTVGELTQQCRFFHWHLQYPQVFAKGGFDVVLGNPPWERVKLQEQEFFAERSPEIANAVNAAARKRLIAALPKERPNLWAEWRAASRIAEGESLSIRQTGRYPFCGQGDVNTYSLFVENGRQLRTRKGRVGMIVPSGIATDNTTRAFFEDLISTHELAALLDFENRQNLFPGVGHGRMRFCLLTIAAAATARVAFQLWNTSQLLEPTRTFELSPEDVFLLNPNTKTCPVFPTRRDAEITKGIYRRVPVLWLEADEAQGNPWGLRFMAMFHMANDSSIFATRADLITARDEGRDTDSSRTQTSYLPLVEAKMVHHFDHRYGDYELQADGSESTILPEVPDLLKKDPSYKASPRYWIAEHEVNHRLAGKWQCNWFLGWRDITHATNERTVVGTVIPRYAANDKFLLMLPHGDRVDAAILASNLAAFVLDYSARQKLGGISLKYFTMKQLPVLRPSDYSIESPFHPGKKLREWVFNRSIELIYTAWDLEPFARDVGFEGPPFRWDAERRFMLRCELDAAFFHLYGLNRDDTAYIMDTFPIVRKHDEKAHGEYRTKRVILELYDALAEATRTATHYQTRLDPPPAALAVTHPWRWEDKPLVLPSEPRVPLPERWQYVVSVMIELVWQADGKLTWPILREATDLLADRLRLSRVAKNDLGAVTDKWLALKGDVFDLTQRWDQLSGLCFAGKLRVVRRNGELVVELLSVEGHRSFPHVRFDARLALAAARSLPDATPTPVILAETKRIEELVTA